MDINDRLREAAKLGHAVELEALLREPGCDALAKNNNGMTALMWAAGKGQEACVRLLLPVSGVLAKVSAVRELKTALREPACGTLIKDINGMTALMGAVFHGHEACVQLLLPTSDVLAADGKGQTLLMHAAYFGHEACVRILLPISNVLASDRKGMTASMIAHSRGRKSVALLIDAYVLSQSEKASMEESVRGCASRKQGAPRV